MEGPGAAARGNVSLHNFSARLWEQLVHFHVMRLTDSLFLWVGATPHLRNLSVAMCTRYDPIPVSTALLGDMSDTTSTGLAQRLGGVQPFWYVHSFPEAGGAQVVTRGQHTLMFKQESGSRLDLQIKENLEQGCLLVLSELEGFYWSSLFY
ncbi:proteasome assembly chaperone 4 isoform X3 [Lagenorhynchus albirostris]|uniref:proteasome assembly chaperone 4 isoform X3 n=1 Tax=Lagenorhynchus albirostris TaxID=27610 RepID=UPI0028ECEFAF|nr:proteasome assembly chaperone 4 isoform X3 [Lagenorhynchus albirostris]